MAERRLKVFLDSNVILSGLISDRGSPRIILDLLGLDLPFLSGTTGQFNIIEIERNIHKKVPELLPVYKKYFTSLNLEIVSLPSLKEIKKLQGSIASKDLPVLASAVKGNVDFLITGDKKDFAKTRVRGKYHFKIASPAEFIETILPEFLKEKSSGKPELF
jgi:predicted nucleic acid-binding protein